MKKIFVFATLLIICISTYASGTVSIFSTSTDWERVTGLRYSQFDISFIRDKSIGGKGIELYFLDGFPCIGQAETARTWVSPSNFLEEDKKANMNISCVQRPTQVQFAWRSAASKDFQARTTGIMTCQITGNAREIKITLNNCIKGKNWDE